MNKDFFIIADAKATPIASEYIAERINASFDAGYSYAGESDLIWLVLFNAKGSRDYLRLSKASGFFCVQLETTIFVKVSIEEAAYILADPKICKQSTISQTMVFPDFNVLLYDDDQEIDDYFSNEPDEEPDDDDDDDA